MGIISALNKKLFVIGVYLLLFLGSNSAIADMSSDDFESILINWGDSFAELSGTRQKYYENDVGGCLINGGDWIVEDIRGESGEYCIDHETLEPFLVVEGDAPIHVIPETKSLILRYQWISWMFSSWDHIYSHPMDVFDDIHEINALYNQESGLLKNDEHLAVYWLLHFHLLMDPRFEELNHSLSESESELIQAARLFLENITINSNFSVADENSNLFRERRARAMYAVSYQQAGTIKQLLDSWRIDSNYIGSAQVYNLVELAEASNMSSWVLNQIDASNTDKVGTAYIQLMLGRNNNKTRSTLRSKILDELEFHHDRWSSHGSAKNMLTNLVDVASVKQIERVVDLYYGIDSLDANYFELKRTIQERGGLGLATSRFADVDLSEVDRVLSIKYFNGGHQKFLEEFAKLDILSQEALVQKAQSQGITFDASAVFKELWRDSSGKSQQLLTKLIAQYNFLGEDSLAEIVGDSSPDMISRFLSPQRRLLTNLFELNLKGLQQSFPHYDEDDVTEFKGDVLNALSFFNNDESVNTMMFDTLTDTNKSFALKDAIYTSYLGVYAEDYLAMGESLRQEDNRLWQKGMMHKASVLLLNDGEKHKVTELINDILSTSVDDEYEYAIDDIFQVLQSLDSKSAYAAVVELVLNSGYNEINVNEKFTAMVYETLRLTKSFFQLENYSLFLANPAMGVNTDLQEVELMSEVLSWKLRLKGLDREDLLILHDVLLTGIERGLTLGVVNDLSAAFKTVKKIETRIRKHDKKKLKSGNSFLGQLIEEDYTPVDEYFYDTYLMEQYEALESGKIRKRLAKLKNSPPVSLNVADDSMLSNLSGKHVNKRVWQSDISALFVDQDNALQFASLDETYTLPFKITSFLKNQDDFIPLLKTEWRRHTTIWKDGEGDIVEWVWLGTSRLLLFSSNTISDTSSYEYCDINQIYCEDDYGYALEELESLPIDSKYIEASILDVSVRFASILEFSSAKSAVVFYSELGKHKPVNYDSIDPWYVKGQGQLRRHYQTSVKPSFGQHLIHNASGLYYSEPKQELQSALVKQEQGAMQNGIEWLSYDINRASQLSSVDASLYHVFNPFFNIDSAKPEAFAEWVRVFKSLEEALSFGGVHALYPDLNTVRLKINSSADRVSLKQLEDTTGITIPEKLRSVWQEAAGISLIQENGLEFKLFSPTEVIDKTLPERVWVRNSLSEFDDSKREAALSFFDNSWLFMRVRDPYFDEVYYFYEPSANQVLVFKKGRSLAHIDEQYTMKEFSPAEIDIRVSETLRSIPVKADPIVESEQFFLVGDENEAGDKMYVSFSADFGNNVLSLVSNIPSFEGDYMTYRYPTRDALVNDRNILMRNFKTLGMETTTKSPVVE